MKIFKQNLEKGQALITATIFFLIISMTIILGFSGPVFRAQRITRDLSDSRKGYFLAEAGVEDVTYRLKNGLNVGSSQTLSLSGYSATTDVEDTINGKTITSESNWDGRVKDIEVTLAQAAGVAFNYGLQGGNGGVTMDGGSTIVGNIYANGSINAISATITGTAVAADSAALTADQSNDTPTTPPNTINFRDTSATQDFAQSFQTSVSDPINKFQFYIKKVGAPANVTLRLVADNAGSPSTTQLPIGTATLIATQVTTSFGWVDVVIPSSVSLISGTTYWVVLDNSTQSSTNYYVMGANNTYTSGVAKVGAYSGTWTGGTLDGYFRVYTGGITSTIGGATYPTGLMVGQTGVGDAWASTIKGTTAAGHMYCITGTNNNKACDTSKGSPPSQPLPFSDANIQEWKDEGTAGGTTVGNVTVNSSGGTIGPKKITGNLTVNGGGTLTLTGTIYVQGNVLVTGGGSVKLPANFGSNSGTLIAEGTITVNGGGSAGSGSSGSFLFMVSTSKCPNDINCGGVSAININGGGGAIAANAQRGTVSLGGGASINAVTANQITITGGSTVTYDHGLASPSFVSGPSGGYQISGWKETK